MKRSVWRWLRVILPLVTLFAALVVKNCIVRADGPPITPYRSDASHSYIASGTYGTPTYEPVAVPTAIVKPGVYRPAGEGAFPYADNAFQRLWARVDGPVAGGTPRAWAWGPGPNTRGLLEPYREDPTGLGQHLVQYFDKSRMELNDPSGDSADPFYVSTGLLTVELVSGLIQQGNDTFAPFRPACIPVAGDQGDKSAPTYAAMGRLSNTRTGDHPVTDRTGVRVIETVDRAGNVGSDPSKGSYEGLDLVHYEPSTRHNVPRIFWDFLNAINNPRNQNNRNDQNDPYDQNNQSNSIPLVSPQGTRLPWYFSSGLPISEPYWARAVIAGQAKDVMVQLFERRALTYVPQNTAEWKVEMANIGQHYFDWRYRNLGVCSGQEALVGTPTPPRLAPTPPVPPTPLSSTPGPTEEQSDGPHATIDVVAYVDSNGNDSADPGEGLTGLRVVLIHRQTNASSKRTQTDANGHAHLEWRWEGAVNVALPDIGWIDTVEASEIESKSAYRGQSAAWTSDDDGSLLLKVRVKLITLPAVIP